MVAERVLMGLLLVGIAVGCTLVLSPFLSAILGAGILVFSTWPVFEWMRLRLRLPRPWAAGAMVLLTSVLIVLPLGLAAPGGAEDAAQLRRSVEALLNAGPPAAPLWLRGVPLLGPSLADTWTAWVADLGGLAGVLRPLRPYFGLIAEAGISLLLGIAGGALQFLLALLIAYFFWLSGDTLAVYLTSILRRVAGARADRLIEVTGNTVRGTVYGILGTAVIQGLLTAFGLWLAGVPRPVLLGVVAGLIAVLPVGPPLVWVPATFWLLSQGETGWGVFLGIYGLVAISGADNLIRPYFIARGARLPFLLTILGVLGGALAFGLLGIFLGPVLLGVGFTLVGEFARGDTPGASPGHAAESALGLAPRAAPDAAPGTGPLAVGRATPGPASGAPPTAADAGADARDREASRRLGAGAGPVIDS